MRSHPWMRFGAVLLLTAVSVAACDETTTDPLTDFDAEVTAEVVDSMIAAAETDELEDAFSSLEAAGILFGGPTGTVLASETPLNPDAAALLGLGDLAAADLFPTEYLGVTFEWHEAEMAYVPSDATGAPEDGVRIIYYAIDPTTEKPASPLNALGYVDLRDLSAMDSDRLGVKVVRTSGDSDVTLADYHIDVSFSFTQSSFVVDVASVGFLSNGTDQLNFDLAQGVSATDTEVSITQDYSLDEEGTDNAMSFTATITADPRSESDDPETMDAMATISNGASTQRLEIMWADQALEGTIYHNDQAVVLIGGDLDNPQFTDTNGNALSQQQLNALQKLWDDIGDMFDFVEDMFGFAT